MIPIPGFSSVKYNWIEISSEGFVLYGFLAFLASDHYFPEYLKGDGLADLDSWTTKDCAVFVVQSPSSKWIEYTRETDHTWWRLFGHLVQAEDDMQRVLVENADIPLIETEGIREIKGTRKTLREFFAPCLNHFHYNSEIEKILDRFNLNPTDHPCLILFRDLKDRIIWHVDFSDWVDLPERELRIELRRWFASSEFKKILKEPLNA